MIALGALNPEQRLAAETVDGPLLILAGAGSGKTRTITYRMAHMIDNLHIPASTILGITFTNKAAKEMKERVHTLLGSRKARGITLCTFHSLAVRILKKEITLLGYSSQFSIYDSSDQLSIIREALKNYNAEKNFDRQEVLAKIGQMKNHGIRHDDFAQSAHFDAGNENDLAVEYCYHFYQDKLKFYNAIDFDDILYLAVKLFKENPDVAKKYSQKYQYIMIDEYQDTNSLQFEFIRGLTSAHNNLCVVGDDDQSIYGFRGADISNILSFEKHFPGAVVLKLEENYRSTMPILNLANHVIKKNRSRREKTLWSRKKSDDLPLLWACGHSEHEAQIVVEDILQYQNNGGSLADCAILYRSNTQAAEFEEQLKLSCIPYALLGGQKFYDKKEIKDLIAYLSVIHNAQDEISLRRILNVPHRGIGTATLEKFSTLSLEQKKPLFEMLEQHAALIDNKQQKIKAFTDLIGQYRQLFAEIPLHEALGRLVEEIDYHKFIEKIHEDSPKQMERRKNDVAFFLRSAERFSLAHKQWATLESFVEKLLLQDNQDTEEENGDEDVRPNQVTLMTLHSAKGLEFDRAYLVGMEEQLLPHKKIVFGTKGDEDIDEERRLAYVGITRAREQLIMTYCKQRKIYGKETPRYMSRFVDELKDQNLFKHQDRTTFGHLSPEEAANYKKDFFTNLINSGP